jgi:hypothetical protein
MGLDVKKALDGWKYEVGLLQPTKFLSMRAISENR